MVRNLLKNNTSLGSITLRLKFIFSLLVIILSPLLLRAQSQTVITLTNDGTFVVPCGVTQITVEAIGGGGSGGTRNSLGNGGGGGGGAYSKKVIQTQPNESFVYSVGKGGVDPLNLNRVGYDGTPSVFGENLVVAAGGNGGGIASYAPAIGGIGGLASNSIGDVTFSGGNGGNGAVTRDQNSIINGGNSGAGGGAAGSLGNGGNAIGATGGLGSNLLGGNGANGESGFINVVGATGLLYGGGGGGALKTSGSLRYKGGNGANGIIQISYIDPIRDYCTNTSIQFNNVRPITSVTLNNLLNTSSANETNTPYESFCNTANVVQGSSNTITVKVNTRGNNTQRITIFIDWNQDGDFNDAQEVITTSNTITNSTGTDAVTATSTINTPYTALIGITKMRIVTHSTTTVTSCYNGPGNGQVEDYLINIIEADPCVAPTNQPSNLILSANATTLSGIFYESFPSPDSYLVVYSRTNTAPPVLTNGVNYAINQQIGTGYYVISNNSNTSFSTNFNIIANQNYRVWVFSFNQYCLGGPIYYRTNPTTALINNTTNTYCISNMDSNQVDDIYLTRVSFVGIINESTNTSSYSTNPRGYQDFTGLQNFPIQERGEGVNISIQNNRLAKTMAWVDWNRNGIFSDSELVYTSSGISIISTTFGFIIPSNQALGQYRVRIRISESSNITACNSGNWPNYHNGETEDYLLTVIDKCNSSITSVVNGENCGEGNVQLSAFGNSNTTGFVWYRNETGGAPIANTTSNTWNTPVINTTTTFWVAARNNNCESRIRKPVIAKISALASITFFPENPVVCGENDMIRLTANGDTETVYLVNETFENNSFGTLTRRWLQDNLSQSYRNDKEFKIVTSTMIPNYNVWFPAISSGENGNKFILSNSDKSGANFDHYIHTQGLNTNGFNSLYLSVKVFFSRYQDDFLNPDAEYITIQVNPDTQGDGSMHNSRWITIERFSQDIGIGTRFRTLTYDVSEYIGKPNVKFRVLYKGAYTDGLALDDILVWGVKPLNTSFEWTNSSNVDAYTDAAGTIPYQEGTQTSALYVRPNYSQLQYESFQFTATAILNNGCITTKDITVGNKTKIWNGTNNNWDQDNNWLPFGKPTIENCVIIPSETKISGQFYDAFARNVTVKPSGDLEVLPNNNMIIDEFLKVENNGVVNIRDRASLLQIKNNFTNSGVSNIERKTPPMYMFGVNFWGSPLTLSSNYTLGDLIPNIEYRYSYDPRVWSNTGHFVTESATRNMVPAKGYILEVPTNFPTFSSGNRQVYTATFSGTPNNGVINIPLYQSTRSESIANNAQLNNLLSNPYPSAIDASKFILDPRNENVLDGTIYIWANLSGISNNFDNPYYNNYTHNYSTDDYLIMNIAGSVQPIDPNMNTTNYQYISSGQGFYVKALANNATAVMDNEMRVKNENEIFYRTNNSEKSLYKEDFDRNQLKQIWLDLKSNDTKVSQTLIGYHTNATNEYDRGLDSEVLGISTNEIYSINETKKLAIQTRKDFHNDEIIPIGILVNQSGTQNISITKKSENFKNQVIYLIDKELGISHNLNENDYNFKAENGRYDKRFELRFTNSKNQKNNANPLQVYNINKFSIVSNNVTIQNIQVFDLNGRLIQNINNINLNEYIFNFEKSNTTYILNINLSDGTKQNIKTIY